MTNIPSLIIHRKGVLRTIDDLKAKLDVAEYELSRYNAKLADYGHEPCSYCDGTGEIEIKFEGDESASGTCHVCSGDGVVNIYRNDGDHHD